MSLPLAVALKSSRSATLLVCLGARETDDVVVVVVRQADGAEEQAHDSAEVRHLGQEVAEVCEKGDECELVHGHGREVDALEDVTAAERDADADDDAADADTQEGAQRGEQVLRAEGLRRIVVARVGGVTRQGTLERLVEDDLGGEKKKREDRKRADDEQ